MLYWGIQLPTALRLVSTKGEICLAEQQCARIRADRAAVKRRHNLPTPGTRKLKLFSVKLCTHREPPLKASKSLSQNKFDLLGVPIHYFLVRNPG